MSRPVIGLTLDHEDAGGYAASPWYALRDNYCAAVAAAGGLPVTLPHEPESAADYLDLIDGLIVTGGNFDVDPAIFGADSRHATVTTKDRRTAFELAITNGALEQDMPILGICGGQQLLNVVLGGTLIQHIPDEIEGALEHEQPTPRDQPAHDIAIEPGTRLHQITGVDSMAVNTAHHQAVATVAGEVTINAVAPDGVIEGIELSSKAYCIGVQWHPEYGINEGDRALFDALVAAAG